MLTAAFDPTTTQIIVAVIGGGGLALSATISSYFTYRAARASKTIVANHIADETESTKSIAWSLEAMSASLERHGGALDSILDWQGKHEAQHKLDAARNVAEAAVVKSHLTATEKSVEASQALVRDLHDRPHTATPATEQ